MSPKEERKTLFLLLHACTAGYALGVNSHISYTHLIVLSLYEAVIFLVSRNIRTHPSIQQDVVKILKTFIHTGHCLVFMCITVGPFLHSDKMMAMSEIISFCILARGLYAEKHLSSSEKHLSGT